MKVVCDNCGAIYKIPEKKLVKDVNKATCRKCGHRIMIRREAGPDGSPTDGEEATLIAHAAQGAHGAAVAESAAPALSYPPFGQASEEPTPLPTSPLESRPAAVEPAPVGYAPAPVPFAHQASPAAPPPAVAPAAAPQAYVAPRAAPSVEPTARTAHDPIGDMAVVSLAQGAALVGAVLLGIAGQNFFVAFIGLFVALWGVFTSLLVLISGHWGRRPAWSVTSAFGGLFMAAVLAGVISLWTPVMRFIQNPDVTALVESLTHGGAIATAPAVPVEPPVVPPVVLPPVEPPSAPTDAVATADEPPPVADAEDEPRGLLDVIAEPPPAPEPPAAVEPASSGSSSSRTPTSSSSSSSRTPSSASSSGSSGRAPSSTSSSHTPTSSSSSSSSSSRTPTSSSSSSSSPSSTSSSSSGSSDLPTSIPTTVIDIQIRNNKNVKACFAAYKATYDTLPPVTLRFTLEPSGRVSSGSLRETEYQGSSLESCLVGSIKGIDFPQFSGTAKTLNYPFRF
ncbi:MAG: AgmX/PglI C-terminal domain-containing protein [Pseudomonadota bacterium]